MEDEKSGVSDPVSVGYTIYGVTNYSTNYIHYTYTVKKRYNNNQNTKQITLQQNMPYTIQLSMAFSIDVL